MQALCYYTNNSVRLAHILEQLCKVPQVQLHAVRGTAVRGFEENRCVGEEVELLLVAPSFKMPILATNSEDFKGCDKTVVDYDLTDRQESFYVQILRLCEDKHRTSGNAFRIEFAGPGCTIEVSAAKGSAELEYTARTPKGDVTVAPDGMLFEMLAGCDKVRVFEYTVETPTCTKSVSVAKGQLEIMREVSHYCGKPFILTKLKNGCISSEMCISNNGCCTAMPACDRFPAKVKRIPFTRMTVDDTHAVYGSSTPFEKLLKAQTFCDAMGRGE